jgi:hypothetical protein
MSFKVVIPVGIVAAIILVFLIAGMMGVQIGDALNSLSSGLGNTVGAWGTLLIVLGILLGIAVITIILLGRR